MITVPTNGDVTQILEPSSMASDITSEIMDFEHARNCSIQAIWSGHDADNASMTLEISNDRDTASFCTMPDSSYIMVAGIASHMWILTTDLHAYRYMRVNYDKGSNTTGSIRMNCTAKGKDRY